MTLSSNNTAGDPHPEIHAGCSQDHRRRGRIREFIHAAALCCALALPAAWCSAQTETARPMNASDLRIALEKLHVTGTVMYIAAHPDDENTALLADFSKGKKYRTVYLSLTRGEGGQNILGAEKGEDLGILRTEELLAARRIDGAEQMFSRAIDFGFSKSPVETIAMWGRDAIVRDIVWAIRKVRPDIIITRFSPTEGGHGNHTASAILANEAYQKSGDPAWYPDQLQFVKPWKAKRLFFNRIRFGASNIGKEAGDLEIDAGAYNPMLGLSYTEIAGISRSLHKTQAMGSEQRRGKYLEYFRLTDEDRADVKPSVQRAGANAAGRDSIDDDLFSGVETSWKRYNGGGEIDKLLSQAERTVDPEHPEKILPLLMQVYHQLGALASTRAYDADPVIERKRYETASVIASCLGLHCSVLSALPRFTSGEPMDLTMEMIVRRGVPVSLRSLKSALLRIDTTLNKQVQLNVNQDVKIVVSIPTAMRPTQPYWLIQPQPDVQTWRYSVPSQTDVGSPENPDSLSVSCEMTIAGEPITFSIPVRYRVIDPTAGELYRPVVIVPAIDVAMADKMLVWAHEGAKAVAVRVSANTTIKGGELRLSLPKGYSATPSSVPLGEMKKEDDKTYSFTVHADAAAVSGVIGAQVRTASSMSGDSSTAVFTMHGIDLSYPHIIPQYVMHEAQLKAVRADIMIAKRKIGYIMGSGDEVPEALSQCGYDVTMIGDDTLSRGSLATYGAIVVGVRAYNVRPSLRLLNSRLLNYVRNGGTVVEQYQTPGKDVGSIGPYPFKISRDRVTDENAEIVAAYRDSAGMVIHAGSRSAEDDHLDIYHKIMNVPNPITKDDFNGWVQERGLSFADTWDEHYTAPFLLSDPGETPKQGSLIVARYGKGYYCYTGLSFFRQLPAGVPGAFKLLGNLIELTAQ